MQSLAQSFVPVADEVARLQREDDPECRFFQGFMEKGHYGGRTEPTKTRQGIYAVTPGGDFLSSVNTRRAEAVVDMLERALSAWEELSPEVRLGDAPDLAGARRFEQLFPEGGMVLRVTSRDLDQDKGLHEGDWRRDAWNQDFAWFRGDEVRTLIPEARVGARLTVPRPLAARIACLHLVDNVRGQTPAYRTEDLKELQLELQVTAVREGALEVELHGKTRTERGTADASQGIESELLGRATIEGERFVAFEAVALGRREGSTRYNARGTQAPSWIGFALVLDEDPPRVAPASYWRYGWR